MKIKVEAHSLHSHFTKTKEPGEMKDFVGMLSKIEDMERFFPRKLEMSKLLALLMPMFHAVGIEASSSIQHANAKLLEFYNQQLREVEEYLELQIKDCISNIEEGTTLPPLNIPCLLDTQKFPIHVRLEREDGSRSFNIVYDGLNELGRGTDQWVVVLNGQTGHTGMRLVVGTCNDDYGNLDVAKMRRILESTGLSFLKGEI
ncbi:MAG: hypothetical protein EOM68_26955 [Spirochaetia bacterium]|nr:hypothetical protein [Spirochaetia bacterium]